MFRGLFESWTEARKAEDLANKEAIKTNSYRKNKPTNQTIGPETKEPISNETTALIKRPANK